MCEKTLLALSTIISKIELSNLEELRDICLQAILGEFETNKVEIKEYVDIDLDYFQWQFIRSIAAIANTPPDHTIPCGLLIVGARNRRILNNLNQWAKDDNEYQNLIRAYCSPMISFSFYRFEHEGNHFGVFVIPDSDHRPHVIIEDMIHNGVRLAKGQIYIREGSQTRVALKREINRYVISDFSHRIDQSLDELSSKDSQITEVRFLPEDADISPKILDQIKLNLLENITKVRKILRGLS